MGMMDGYESDRLYEIDRALTEWKAARLAIFSYPMISNPSQEQLNLWVRLANAEHALMAAGEGYR